MIRFLFCLLPLPAMAGTLAMDFDDSPVELCEAPDAAAIWRMSYDKSEFPEIFQTRADLYEASCPGQEAPPVPVLVDGELPPCVEAHLDDLACLDTLKHQPGLVRPRLSSTSTTTSVDARDNPAPIPLPPSLLLLLGAMGLAGGAARRRG